MKNSGRVCSCLLFRTGFFPGERFSTAPRFGFGQPFFSPEWLLPFSDAFFLILDFRRGSSFWGVVPPLPSDDRCQAGPCALPPFYLCFPSNSFPPPNFFLLSPFLRFVLSEMLFSELSRRSYKGSLFFLFPYAFFFLTRLGSI